MQISIKVPDQQLRDELLVSRMVRGDQTALESMYDQYAPQVLGIILQFIDDSAVAEALLQETFWQVWKGASGYQARYGTVAQWLYRIGRKLAIAYANRTESIERQAANLSADAPLDTTPEIRGSSKLALLTALPRKQQQVITLAFLRGLTQQEIAEVTGEPLATISSLAKMGLEEILARWEATGDRDSGSERSS